MLLIYAPGRAKSLRPMLSLASKAVMPVLLAVYWKGCHVCVFVRHHSFSLADVMLEQFVLGESAWPCRACVDGPPGLCALCGRPAPGYKCSIPVKCSS